MTIIATTLPESEAKAALLEALPAIQRTAIRLTAAYSWANPHIEVDDLTQLGTLACLEASQRGLRVVKGNPAAFLVAIARRAMQRRCDQLTGLVGLPRR